MHRHPKRNGRWLGSVFLHLLGRIALICLLLLVAMVLIVAGVAVAIQLFIFWIEHFTSGP